MFKSTKKPQIDTLIDVRTRILGDVEFAGGLHLDGVIEGNVTGIIGSETTLMVSDKGEIVGSVSVCDIMLDGTVRGNIDASRRVKLGEHAFVAGNVRYGAIEAAVGAQIQGALAHNPEEEPAAGLHIAAGKEPAESVDPATDADPLKL